MLEIIKSELSWDEKNLAEAKLASTFSKDPGTKCGAYICTLDNIPMSKGYNGFPRGMRDLRSRLENRDYKLAVTLHAEENALAFSPTNDLSNAKIYTWPFMPCAKCAGQLIQRRINTIVAPKAPPERWKQSCDWALELFEETGTKVILL